MPLPLQEEPAYLPRYIEDENGRNFDPHAEPPTFNEISFKLGLSRYWPHERGGQPPEHTINLSPNETLKSFRHKICAICGLDPKAEFEIIFCLQRLSRERDFYMLVCQNERRFDYVISDLMKITRNGTVPFVNRVIVHENARVKRENRERREKVKKEWKEERMRREEIRRREKQQKKQKKLEQKNMVSVSEREINNDKTVNLNKAKLQMIGRLLLESLARTSRILGGIPAPLW